MVSETAISNDHAKARLVYGRALAALVAAQANWSAISEVKGAERQVIETWATKAKVDLEKLDLKARSKLLDVANNALVSVALGSTRPKPRGQAWQPWTAFTSQLRGRNTKPT